MRRPTIDTGGNNRKNRIAVAARVISSGCQTTRHFDGCFENGDGDEVAVALYRRTVKRPNTALARNIWKYLDKDTVLRAVARLKEN